MGDRATVDLATLAVGDRVAWLETGSYNGPAAVLAMVQRLTRTQFVVDSDSGRTYRFRRAKRAREALREIEALGKGKVNDAAGALGLLKGAWREIEVATREIEIMLADMDGRKKS